MTFVHLRLTVGGYIFDRDGRLIHNARLNPDPERKKNYTSLLKATLAMPLDDPDWVIAKTHKGIIQVIYFTQTQIMLGFNVRLNQFQGCYGSIRPSERQ